MSKVLVTDTNLTNIANAIRSKNRLSDLYKPNQMATAINNLPITTATNGTYNTGALLRNYKIFGNSTQVILPNEYQQVEYLQSIKSNLSYLDLGIKGNETMDFEIKFEMTSDNGTMAWFGGSYTSTTNILSLSWFSGKLTTMSQSNNNNPSSYDYSNLSINTAYTLKKTGLTLDLNGNEQTLSGETTEYETPNNIGLFGRITRSGALYTGADIKIYYFKLWDNGTLVRDMIPCYRKSDEEAGMYDLVNDVFYTNQGTGTFTKGNDVVVISSDNPAEITSVGDLVTSGEHTGKYKIPVTVSRKNLLNESNLQTYTTNGITFTPVYDENGGLEYINANGTATSSAYYADNRTMFDFEGNVSYVLSGCPSGGGNNTYFMYHGQSSYNRDIGNGATITEATSVRKQVAICIVDGQTVNNLKFKPMLRLASITDDTYEPHHTPITTDIYLDEPLRGITEKDLITYLTQKRTNKIKKVTLSAGTHTLSDAKNNGNYKCTQQEAGTLTGQVLTLNAGVSNADVIYELATPTEESIVLPQINFWEGTNIVEISTSVQATQEITYIS